MVGHFDPLQVVYHTAARKPFNLHCVNDLVQASGEGDYRSAFYTMRWSFQILVFLRQIAPKDLRHTALKATTLTGLPVRARHDAFHELIEERNRERCIAVTRAPDHSLRYECLTYRPQGTDGFL